MHHYEKENAKEWQMDLGNNPRPKPAQAYDSDDESEDGGWTQVVSSRPVLPKRFEASSSKLLTSNPPTSKPSASKPPITRPKSVRAKGPDHAATQLRTSPVKPRVTPHTITRKGPAKSRFPTGITLVKEEDNAAKGAFRKGKPHDAFFTLSKTCEKIEPDRTKMYKRLEEIGVRFESFIRPPQFLADCTLLLWGGEEQIAQTIAELKEWISSSDDDPRGPREKTQRKSKVEKFGKVGMLQNKKEEQLDKKIREEAKMHRFQKNPEEGQEFAFQGYFLWPVNEVRPEELLGPSCEAYDPIRTYNHSHIMFETNLSAFKILSNKEAAVQNALQRIEGTMREYVARSGKIYSIYMVQLPEASSMLKDIKILPGPASKVPLLTGASLVGEEVNNYIEEKKDIDSGNHKRMRHALRKIIARLPFYRGQVRMRVLFGTFTLSIFRWPGGATTVPFSDFIKNINMPSTKGILIRE